MIPSRNIAPLQEKAPIRHPDLTYRMNREGAVIRGFTEGKNALAQTIYNILNTERRRYPIYSRSYGVELDALFGEPISFVIPEVKRRISEALLQDDRIQSVDGFSFREERGILRVEFTAHTVYGDISGEKSVNF